MSRQAAFKQARTCPQRTRAGFCDQSLFKVHWDLLQRVHFKPGRSSKAVLTRSGFIGFWPLHLVPRFHSFFFLLSFHVFPCFMSCHLTPFFLLRAHRPLACTRTTYFQPWFQVAQVLTMRFGSLVAPVHLVPPSSQPRALLSRLVLLLVSSFFCPYCAHSYTLDYF